MIKLTLDDGKTIWVAWDKVCNIIEDGKLGCWIHFVDGNATGVKESYLDIREKVRNLG